MEFEIFSKSKLENKKIKIKQKPSEKLPKTKIDIQTYDELVQLAFEQLGPELQVNILMSV